MGGHDLNLQEGNEKPLVRLWGENAGTRETPQVSGVQGPRMMVHQRQGDQGLTQPDLLALPRPAGCGLVLPPCSCPSWLHLHELLSILQDPTRLGPTLMAEETETHGWKLPVGRAPQPQLVQSTTERPPWLSPSAHSLLHTTRRKHGPRKWSEHL
ncbi:hypothetical protein P7K49_012866 [Saguinus oedipus]|uniref:Uncharacterized protein n=1 Tax=Saguinus oedipus TaxID=9490 RepID=A0ABQ9VEK3_SAGOE|nr:hypothetical protein P7K49_012866 [Saguinus oedipus]